MRGGREGGRGRRPGWAGAAGAPGRGGGRRPSGVWVCEVGGWVVCAESVIGVRWGGSRGGAGVDKVCVYVRLPPGRRKRAADPLRPGWRTAV